MRKHQENVGNTITGIKIWSPGARQQGTSSFVYICLYFIIQVYMFEFLFVGSVDHPVIVTPVANMAAIMLPLYMQCDLKISIYLHVYCLG